MIYQYHVGPEIIETGSRFKSWTTLDSFMGLSTQANTPLKTSKVIDKG